MNIPLPGSLSMQENSMQVRLVCCGNAEGVAVELVDMGISSIYRELGRLQSDRFCSDVQGSLRPLIAFCDKQKGISCE